MKTITFKHQRGTTAWRLLASGSRAALLSSALLLAASKLAAMPTVNTISGGPSAGYRDGDTA